MFGAKTYLTRPGNKRKNFGMTKRTNLKGGSRRTRGVSRKANGATLAIFINFDTVEQRLQLDHLAKVHKASRKAIVVALVAEATRLLKRGRKLCALNDAAGK